MKRAFDDVVVEFVDDNPCPFPAFQSAAPGFDFWNFERDAIGARLRTCYRQ